MAGALPDATRSDIGERFERDAETFLMQHGLIPVERNWRCRMGEIDLIMRDGETLVFVVDLLDVK